jgi:hypothetical protein
MTVYPTVPTRHEGHWKGGRYTKAADRKRLAREAMKNLIEGES